ncbi:MAG: multicopper oxidase domain-containing protein [Deltaproteobacteria bacterium]|nr:multicopper oxidase domain-containing protein [Deltaproteobacteria bacterium]
MVRHAKKTVAIVLFLLLACLRAQAATVEYDLTIAWQDINISGKPARGMTINNEIPGPTLRFQEGDTALIRVHNAMDEETSIHWHGILVPPDMDGVPFISFPPIAPGATFTYRFPIRQSGTYWYHSHTGLQEQNGLYGSIVIEPKDKAPRTERDYVVLLSDWTDEDPHEVLRTLKRGSERYAIQKGNGRSILGAARLDMLDDYFKGELQRMPPMDIADVAYDMFLANGRPESSLPAGPEETIRLRVINGSSTTFFYLEFAGGPLRIISADGQDVEEIAQQRLLIGVAETYDVLVRLPAAGAWELRATAHDGSGCASVWLGEGSRRQADDVPKPNLYQGMGELNLQTLLALTQAGAMGMPDREVQNGAFDQPGMMDMGAMDMGHGHDMGRMQGMDMSHMQHMRHGADQDGMNMAEMKDEDHAMPSHPCCSAGGKQYDANFRFLAADIAAAERLAADGMEPDRPWPPYESLRATKSTAFAADKPVREIRLTLDGDMERYVWMLNNKTLAESDSIRIRAGEVVRFIMINRTMMHHPMHLHGHFFRVINGQGDRAPLKHTVNVAPMSTTVIEFAADESGDWFFHCHLLYHMESGMARLVHYEDFTPPPEITAIRRHLYMDPWFFWGEADAMSNMGQGSLTMAASRHILEADWQYGWEKVDDPEWELTPAWAYSCDAFTKIFAGIDLEGVENDIEKHSGVLGFHYLLPLNIEFMTWINVDADFRFTADKSLPITPRLKVFGGTEYDTDSGWEGRAGLAFLLSKNISLIGQWHSDYGAGCGMSIAF